MAGVPIGFHQGCTRISPVPDDSVLFLSHHWPFPPDSGGRLRTYYTLKALAGEFRVCLVSVRAEQRSPPSEADDPHNILDDLDRIESVNGVGSSFSGRTWRPHVLSLLTGRPYTVFLYDWGRLRSVTASVAAETDFDMVHVDTYHFFPMLRTLPDAPVACTYHDVHSEILRRRSAVESNPLKGWYAALQAQRIEGIESRCPDLSDLTIVVSERDRDLVQQRAPGARVDVVPNGLPLRRYEEHGRGSGEGIVFVGSAEWYPNRDAVRFFVDEILPEIRSAVPDVLLTWVGAVSGPIRREFGSVEGVALTGRVDDVRPYVGRAACVVVPLRAGSGTRLKILEAWAHRKAVVSTSIGCEGLQAEDGENLLVRDEPRAFAAAVTEVLTDSDLRRSLGERGYATMERLYDWDDIGRRLVSIYDALMRDGVTDR